MQGGVKLSLLHRPGAGAGAARGGGGAGARPRSRTGSGDAQSGFELTFELPARSPLRTLFLLTGGGGGVPLMRVVLVVTINGRAESIIDGVATNVETQPGEGGVGKLVVKGKDLSALMDIIELPGLPVPGDAAVGARAADPRQVRGARRDPDGDPEHRRRSRRCRSSASRSSAAPTTPTSSAWRSEAGYVFYLEPGPAPGTSKAYWGPEIRVGAAAAGADHRTWMRSPTSSSCRFNFDKETQDDADRVLPGARSARRRSAFRSPTSRRSTRRSALVPPLPPKIEKLNDTAHLSPRAALMTGLAYAGQHSDSVFGSGRLDVARYGRLLKSRQLVGVRGAGLPFDGLYYVKSVTHEIERGSYKQSFSLARNGLISTVPTVPT